MGVISIRKSKLKALVFVLIGLIMVSLSVFNLATGIMQDNSTVLLVGIIGTIFFGFCFVVIVLTSFKTLITKDGDVLMEITDEGIIDLSTRFSYGLIKWEDIKSVRVKKFFFNKYIGIEVNDYKDLLSRSSSKTNRITKTNVKFKYAPINIPIDSAIIKIEEIVKIIDSRLKNTTDNSYKTL